MPEVEKNVLDTSKPVAVFYFYRTKPRLSYMELLAHRDIPLAWGI